MRLLLTFLFVVGLAKAQYADVKPLEGPALENVVAFTKLLGYVRYFHPSDAAFATDWDSVAIARIQSLESAATPQELQEDLRAIFEPYAPTLALFSQGQTPRLSRNLKPPLGVNPLFVTLNLRTILGENDTLLLLRSDRVSLSAQAGVPENFRYEGVNGYVRFPQAVSVPVPKPDQPFLAPLARGVWAAVPLAVYSTSSGTLPKAPIPQVVALPQGWLANNPASLRFRAQRLATVAILWNVKRHLFAYWDAVQTDWEQALRTALQEAAVSQSEAQFTAVLQRLDALLQDGHGFVEQVGRSSYGSHTVPFSFDFVEGQLVITTVAPTAPANLQVGDVVIAIDGQESQKAFEQASLRISGSPQYRRYLTLAWLMGGSNRSAMQLAWQRPSSNQSFSAAIERSVAKPRSLPDHLRENRPPALAQLAPGVVYADPTRLPDRALAGVLRQLETAQYIILDARGYPSGSLAAELLSHLSDQPLEGIPFYIPVVTAPEGRNLVYSVVQNQLAEPKTPTLKAKVAFLINANGAISYAETVLGIAERNKLGLMVGEPTGGANGNTVNFILPSRYLTRWTGLRVQQTDGSRFFGVGIRPQLAVKRTLAGVAASRDEVLEAAFTALSGWPASAIQPQALEWR